VGKQKRSGTKAPADDDFDRFTKLLTALMPLHTAHTTLRVGRYALAGTVLAALIGAAGAIGAAVLKEEKPAAQADRSSPQQQQPPATVHSASPPASAAPQPVVPGPERAAAGGGSRILANDVAPRDEKRPTGKARTSPPATTAPPRTTITDPPARTGRIHDGPHRGTIGWGDAPHTVDVENAGFRAPGDARQGEISASADGIRSTGGVRIARFRSSAANFGRCADLEYASMGTAVAASTLAAGDWICADDGAQYLGTYEIEVAPGGGRTYYQLLATSWFRHHE
jgi:hypothetical protein